MKRTILSFTMLATTLAFSQEKEIKAAFKAIDGDISTANSQISAAEAIIGDKTYLLEPELLEQYYYVKGTSLLKSGKTLEGAAYYSKIWDLAKSEIFTGKDSSKNKVYFVGKAAADASGISGLKMTSYTITTTDKITKEIDALVEKVYEAATKDYNAKNFEPAGAKFKETYLLLKAKGVENVQTLFNAAVSYELAKKPEAAAECYIELINSGQTGAETTYTAVKDGNVESMNKTTWDLLKKSGATSGYTDFKSETSKSFEKDFYEGAVRSLYDSKQYEDAIKYADLGVKKYPDNVTILNLKGLSYYNSGKGEEFVKILKNQIAANPKDSNSWLNLGEMLRENPATENEAADAYKKVVEIDPNNKFAYMRLTYITMGDDEKTMEKYNTLRKSEKMDDANKVLQDRRERFLKALPYAEKWYALDSENIDVVTLLAAFYRTAKNETKATEMKAKEAELKKE
ncbi:MAG: tetratricopeptide repeat protein [Flavobacteriaceae bacterium]|jgi:tetratricopeptide (TPR) repeat protein|nr:tetratricopeptide repeat protein [Flavobacteriaceae bacterium]